MAEDIQPPQGRICAYCGLDHEVHGGCFTGKKPSELRAEADLRATCVHLFRDVVNQYRDDAGRIIDLPTGETACQFCGARRYHVSPSGPPKPEPGWRLMSRSEDK
jgi:hypothetical protein